jgi:hypothetical protein
MLWNPRPRQNWVNSNQNPRRLQVFFMEISKIYLAGLAGESAVRLSPFDEKCRQDDGNNPSFRRRSSALFAKVAGSCVVCHAGTGFANFKSGKVHSDGDPGNV